MMVRRLRFVVVLFVLGLAGGYFYARSQPVLYSSSAVLQIVPPKVGAGILESFNIRQGQLLGDRVRGISEVILSRTRLERIIKEFNLYEAERASTIIEEVVAKMRRDISITPQDLAPSGSGGHLIVKYTGTNPVQVLKVTEKLAASVIDESLRDAVRRAEGTSAFIEGEVEEAERRLVEANKRAKADPETLAVRRLEIETLESIYKSVRSRQFEAKMSVNLERRQIGEQFNLLDAAQLPQQPIGPTRLRMSLLGGAMGIATAVVLAFLAFLYGLTGRRKPLSAAG